MLTDAQKKAIEAECAKYPDRRAACLDALKIVQRDSGWISDERLRDVADFLDMSVHDLEGVATFYSLIFRRPVGRHVILICDSVSCWITGYHAAREHLSERLGIQLGQTSADGRFTLLPIPCLGACDHAPAMMVDEELHGDLTTERIDAILERYA